MLSGRKRKLEGLGYLYRSRSLSIVAKVLKLNGIAALSELCILKLWVLTDRERRRVEVFNKKSLKKELGMGVMEHIRNRNIRERCGNRYLQQADQNIQNGDDGDVRRWNERHIKFVFKRGLGFQESVRQGMDKSKEKMTVQKGN